MKNMISDKRTNPVPGREKKVVLTAMSLAMAVSSCAAGAVMTHDEGERYITVVTTEEPAQQKDVVSDKKQEPEDSTHADESQVETPKKECMRKVTGKIICEDGEPSEEEILIEQVMEEPVQQVILSGTGTPDNYGEGDGNHGYEDDPRDDPGICEMLQTPVEGFAISSPFGPRWGSLHTGIDLALPQGEPIYAANGGMVCFSGYGGGYGNLVKIDHGNGMQTCYAHCSQLLVTQGQQVKRGEKIALVGSTGNSTGPHVHFEVVINGSYVDPAEYLELE